jgi:hypothetical protein
MSRTTNNIINSINTDLLINNLSTHGVNIASAGGLTTIGSGGLTSTSGVTTLGISTIGVITGTSATFSGLLTASNGLTSTVSTTTLGATTIGVITGTSATFSGLITASNGLTSTVGTTTLGATTIGVITGTSATFSGLLTASDGFTSTISTTTLGATTIGIITGTSATFSGTLGITGLATFGTAGLTSTAGTTTLGATTVGAITGTTATYSGLLTANNGLTITTAPLTAVAGTFSGLLTASNGFTSTAGATTLGATTIGAITGTSATLSGIVSITDITTSTTASTGALIVTGDIASQGTVAAGGTIKLYGTTSGYTSIKSPAVAGSGTFTLPDSLPTANNAFLVSSTLGVLTYINGGDSVFPSFTFNGNQSQTNQNITNLIYAAGPFNIGIEVDVVATSSLTEYFILYGVLSPNPATGWSLSTITVAGDYTGVSFNITSTGQIRYTSPSYPGFTSLAIRWTKVVPDVSAINVTAGTNTTGTVPTSGAFFHVNNTTYTDSTTVASGTLSNFYGSYISSPNLQATNTLVTTTNGYTLYIDGPPNAGTNETITNNYSLYVASGETKLLGGLNATTGSFSSTINMNSNKINNVAEPTSSSDASTKGYVDSLFQGISTKTSVLATTTVAGTLASDYENGDIIDGVTLTTGQRVLIKNQSSAIENGIYIVNASGSPTRSSDFAIGAGVSGTYVFIEQGTINTNAGYICTSLDGSDFVGTDPITFVQFSGAGSITAGTGLTKIGNTLSVDALQTQITSVGTLTSLNVNSPITINGSTSGIASITSTTGTFNFNLPVSSGTTGQILSSGGTGSPMVWESTNGSGNVVLTTSPTLITPNIGAATGTSLNLSGLTVSQAVFTDSSKNLVSVANTGTGDNVLASSPTLVTPNIGAATASSINTSGVITSTYNSGAPLIVANSTLVTNLNANYLNGNTFAIPGAIGSTTPSTGAFTTINGTTGTLTSTLNVTGLATFGVGGLTSTSGTTTLGTSTIGAITGTSASFSSTLGVTGLATFGVGGLTSTAGTTTLGVTSINGNVNMNSNRITSLANPIADTDAANKGTINTSIYAINSKGSVVVATTVTGTLSTAYANGSTIDGVVLVTGNRILIKNQSSAIENGIYTVNASGSPTRSLDFNTGTNVFGAYTLVTQGTVNSNSIKIVSNIAGSDLVGTDGITFGSISGNTVTGGTGITVLGSVVSVNAFQSQITTVGTLGSLAVSANTSTGTLTIGGVNYNPNASDIPTQQTFLGSNNQASAADITGLLFSYTTVRSFTVQMAVTVIATANLYSQIEIKGVQHGSGWYFVVDSIGDDTLIVLSITSTGQIQYTSPSYTGYTSLTFKFKGSSVTL